jgi:hypothetical protein
MKWRFWKFISLRISCFLFFVIAFQYAQSQNIEQSALQLFSKVDSSLRNTNSLKFKVELYARMKKEKDYRQEAIFKIQRKPLKIYYRQFIDDNIELLYDETRNKEKALVNPDGFPYTNLNLSPYSPLILKRQHHSIFEADPLYTLDQMKKMFDDCKPDKCFIELYDTLIDGKSYKIIKYDNPYYKIEKFKTKNDIHILDLSKELGVNFYSLVCLNDDFDSSTEIEKGEDVVYPTSYAKRIYLIINQKTNQILEAQVYDGKGLFEKIKYLWIKKDVVFKEIDFQKDNPEYNF